MFPFWKVLLSRKADSHKSYLSLKKKMAKNMEMHPYTASNFKVELNDLPAHAVTAGDFSSMLGNLTACH